MQKNEYDVKKTDDGKYLLKQTHELDMDFDETMQMIARIDQDIIQTDKQIKQMKTDIEKDVHKKNLDHALKNLVSIKKLKEQLNEVMAPQVDKLKAKIIVDIVTEKAKKGYKRVSDSNQKMAMASAIMAEIAVKHKVDIGYPFMRELRKEFDKI